jgi:hypothetical protein
MERALRQWLDSRDRRIVIAIDGSVPVRSTGHGLKRYD